MNLPLTDQQDLRDIWNQVSLGPSTPEAVASKDRMLAKYGQDGINQALKAYEARGAYGNPALQSLARNTSDALIAYMNTTPFEKYARRYTNLKFSSWAEALALLGRANLIPQLK